MIEMCKEKNLPQDFAESVVGFEKAKKDGNGCDIQLGFKVYESLNEDSLRFVNKDALSKVDLDAEPKVDIAICSECGWRGSVNDCIKGQDGDWESGYYEVDFCPKCAEGGCVDDYDMTPERAKEWEKWCNKKDFKKEIG